MDGMSILSMLRFQRRMLRLPRTSLHTAVERWSHTRTVLLGSTRTSSEELVVIFQSCKQLVQSVCSVLSLVESSFGEGEENEASLRILDSVHGSLPGSLVQAVGTLPATAEWVDRAQPHVQMLLFLGSTDDVLSMASAWYRLRLKLQFQSVLGEAGGNWTDFWRSTVSSLRDMTRMSQEPAKSKEDQTAEAEVARAFCSGLALLEDLLRLPTALAALEASGLAEVVWSSVMQEDPTNFHLQRLPTECAKSLLRWLHLDPVSKVLKSTTLKSKTLRLYMNFLEDVLELDTCRDKDIAEVQTTRTCSPSLAQQGKTRDNRATMPGAIRRRGGDLELCRLAIVHEGALPWFPLNPARLPNLSNDLPDPFVNLLPKLDETLKRPNDIQGLCASSPNDQAFKEAVARALPGVASGRRTAMVLGAITSRVLLNRQVAIEEGLRKLKEWTTESLNEETNVSRRSKQALVDRMFAGTLLPHAAVIGAMGYVGWYTCPRGHPYSVGECTRPMQLGRCPVVGCGAPIGGESHRNVEGVRTVNQESTNVCRPPRNQS
eukprot:g4419.t1